MLKESSAPAPIVVDQPADFVSRHYGFNFTMNLLDGAFFTLGLAFYSTSTILPLYASHLVDAPWLISLVPALTQAGWYLPQLLTARRFAGLQRRLPFAMRTTAHERLPVLLLGLSILLWPGLPKPAALAVFLLLLAWQATGGGLTAPGWVDLVARVTPVNRRGRLLGFTNLTGSAFGAVGALLAGYLLRTQPYPRGFALVFLTGAVWLMVSWIFLGLIREPPIEVMAPPQSRGSYWRALPAVLQGQPNLRRYLLARAPGILGLAANGFLAVYAVERFHLPDSAVGGYTAALLIAGAAANPLLGLLGDRLGHKTVMEASLLAQALALAATLLAPSADWFFLVFALLGIQIAGNSIAAVSIAMEFGQPEERPTIVALTNTTQGVFYLVSPLLGGVVATLFGYRLSFLAALACVGVALLALRLTVREPRHAEIPDTMETPHRPA